MKTSRGVLVKRLPERVTLNQAYELRREIMPLLDTDRPSLVLDLSDVRQLDSAGIELLLRCVEEAMKRNGDVKLAAPSPNVAVLLKLTRVDRLFEIFERPTDAAASFKGFPIEVLSQAAVFQDSKRSAEQSDTSVL
jgi:anti-sigma B factor antagonist